MFAILIAEDDIDLNNIICEQLSEAGYETIETKNGNQVMELVTRFNPDLLILDVMLPGTDGFSICKQIRDQYSLPILMLTARADEFDKVLGLELGADDYLTKPFSLRELLARVKALLRRQKLNESKQITNDLQFADCQIDLQTREICVNNQPIALTRKEFDLLVCLIENNNRVLTREWLLSQLWSEDNDVFDRTIDTHILRLRVKLGRNSQIASLITAIRGIGYRLTKPK